MTISSLNPANPADTAFVGDGAGEIRAVKAAVKAVFPNVGGAITKPSDYGPAPGSTQPTESDFSQLFTDMVALSSTVGGIDTGIVPIGTIAMWSGTLTGGDTTALNAKGWYICDGTNGTPNLEDRFIVGAGTTALDQFGGSSGSLTATLRTSGTYQVGNATPKTLSASVTLTEANFPEHYHYLTEDTGDGETETAGQGASKEATIKSATGIAAGGDKKYWFAGGSTEAYYYKSSSWGNASPTAVTISHDATAFAHEHDVELTGDILPPHYAVYYIIYKGAPVV